MSQTQLPKIAGFSSAIVAFLLALATAYITMERHITALAVAAISMSEVEHVVDLKTGYRLDEIFRRLSQIDEKLDHLRATDPRGNITFSQEKP